MYSARRFVTRPSFRQNLFLHGHRPKSLVTPAILPTPPIRSVSHSVLTRPRVLSVPSQILTRHFATEVPPLLANSNTIVNWDLFPDFARIRPEHVVPAFEALVADTEREFAEREKNFESTWEGTVGLVQDLEDTLERAYGVVLHLNMVKDSPALRAAVQQIQPLVIKLSLRMNQSVPKHRDLTDLKSSPARWASLAPEQRRIVNLVLRDMTLSGVGLPEGTPEKARFNAIRERLSFLSTQFGNNVLDATNKYHLLVNDPAKLDGCPPGLLAILAAHATRRGHDGAHAITLDHPTLAPFLMTCRDRGLREEVYRANVTKAADTNEQILNEILSLRAEESRILNFENYAQLSLSTKMAGNLSQAEGLLDRLFEASLPRAKEEFEILTEFASCLGIKDGLQPWDTAFVSETYRSHLFYYSDEEIAQYFAFPRVLGALFDLARETFAINVRELSPSEATAFGCASTWHPDVRVYAVHDLAGASKDEPVAYFYGDFYSRPEEKKGGAWMDVVTTRMRKTSERVRVPVAYLICNQPPPVGAKPALMKWRDVETMFHEFGHCLNHMLTTVDYPQASGIKGVEWDFVEVASQFMENFCHEPSWIKRLSENHVTGFPMPQEMVDMLVRSREFLSGTAMLRQIHLAKVDLALHSRFVPPVSPTSGLTAFDVDHALAARTTLMPRLPEDRMLCSFTHIFGGGYAAGYYSYKWSEVYSADAYAAFEEAGDRNEVGRRYRETVLALGGATDPREIWKKFRGREEAGIGALLRHSGLVAA